MLEWVEANEVLLWWFALASVAVFVLTLVMLPLLLIRMPADYFLPRRRERPPFARRHPVIRAGLRVLSNLVGCVLLVVGFVLLFLPGQGLLTMLAGLMLTDFPGKFDLERRIIGNPSVRRTVNRLRQSMGRPPLIIEPGNDASGKESVR